MNKPPALELQMMILAPANNWLKLTVKYVVPKHR